MSDVFTQWNEVDTVLLDMDGTLLDLHFDNWFWTEHLPEVYARTHGMDLHRVKTTWSERLNSFEQQLQWYCIDHWSDQLKLNVADLKRAVQHKISWLPGAQTFLRQLQVSGKKRLLITNAHPITFAIKNEVAAIAPWFDECISSHEFAAPKEQQSFWAQLIARTGVDPARCLFVDDSLPVCEAAKRFGIAHIRVIRQPDSMQPVREIATFQAVNRLSDLIDPSGLSG
jgi:putative hydrolase of the HAD superfamily